MFLFRKTYKCENNKCVINKFNNERRETYEVDESLEVCHLTCGQYGSLWPRPTISTTIK